MPTTPTPAPRRRPRPDAGFALIDLVVAAAILSVALLGHASTVLTGHRLSRAVEHRTVALEAARQFIERLRSDPDWEGTYANLVTLSTGVSTGGTGLVGRPPTDYYADYVSPRELGEVRVLVSVPPSGSDLREDAVLPAFGLPYDLNGDGVIDDQPHQGDYVVLPISIKFSWLAPGEGVESVDIPTWLSGAR